LAPGRPIKYSNTKLSCGRWGPPDSRVGEPQFVFRIPEGREGQTLSTNEADLIVPNDSVGVGRRGGTVPDTTVAGQRFLFPGRSHLPATSSWWSSILVATGGALMVVVSLGSMAGDLGNVSIWIWVAAAVVGGVQCLLVAELAARFPERAGGTAQFAFRAIPKGSPTLGALSAWCYWFAWTPGIAVNLILAATYLRYLLWPGVNPLVLAIAIGVVLYAITALGLKLSTAINAGLAILAVAVILIIVVGPALRPSAFHLASVVPPALPARTPHDFGSVLGLVIKWSFVATWSAYAAEIASTVCSEIRHPERYMGRIMSISAGICVFAFSLVPIALFGFVGVEGIQRDPFEVFATTGGIVLGPAGKFIVGLGLAAVLILGAETFIIGSSRTIYQMAQDGHLPRFFAKINRRGAPVGSIAWDAVVIGTMLVVFGTQVVNVVAAANIGYLIVFILMPIAYLVLRRKPGGRQGGIRLGSPFVVVAVLLVLFNLVLLVFGGAQWGLTVILIGLGVSSLILPISLVTRRLRTRAESRAAAASSSVEPSAAGDTSGDLIDINPAQTRHSGATTTNETSNGPTGDGGRVALFYDVLPRSLQGLALGGIAASQAMLPEQVREFHRYLLQGCVYTGRVPLTAELRDIAVDLDLDLTATLAALADADLVHVDTATDTVEVAYPLSGKPSRHRVRIAGGPTLAAMCAVDALGLPLMAGAAASILSSDPTTGQDIHIKRTFHGWDWQPASTVVLLAAEKCDGPLSGACTSTVFHATRELAEQQLASNPAYIGRVLTQPEAIRIAESEFGSLLADLRRSTPEATA
jgi:amino acid transporter